MDDMIMDLELQNPLTDVKRYADSGNGTMIAFSYYLRTFMGELRDLSGTVDVRDLRLQMIARD